MVKKDVVITVIIVNIAPCRCQSLATVSITTIIITIAMIRTIVIIIIIISSIVVLNIVLVSMPFSMFLYLSR